MILSYKPQTTQMETTYFERGGTGSLKFIAMFPVLERTKGQFPLGS